MVHFILRVLVIALGLWVAAHVFHLAYVRDLTTLLIAGLLLGVANAVVRPIITILTLPLTIITLGLFLFVVNGLMVLLVSWLLRGGFVVHGLWRAILITIVVWAVSLVANWFIAPDRARR